MVGDMSEYDDLLDEAMSDFEAPENIAASDIAQADRWGYGLKTLEGKRQQLNAAFTQRMSDLQEVHQVELAKLDNSTERLEGFLSQWLLAWNAGDKKKKSHTLPCGVTVKSTAGRVALEVADGEEGERYTAWLISQGYVGMIPPAAKILTGDAKKDLMEANVIKKDDNGKTLIDGMKLRFEDGSVFDEDGAKVPGVTLSKGPRTVSVTL